MHIELSLGEAKLVRECLIAQRAHYRAHIPASRQGSTNIRSEAAAAARVLSRVIRDIKT